MADANLQVNAVLDFPAKSALITVPQSATFGDLKTAAAKALGLDDAKDSKSAAGKSAGSSGGSAAAAPSAPGGISTDASPSAAAALEGYQLLAISFGAARPIDVSGAKENGSAKAAGVSHLSTLLVIAPAALKPKKVRGGKKAAKEDGGGADGKAKGKSEASDADNYKGLTAKNVLGKWVAAEAGGKKKKYAFEFIEFSGSAVLKSKEFLDLKKEHVLEIVKSDRLNVNAEIDVLDAVVAWGNAQLKKGASGGDAKLSTDSKADASDPGAALRGMLGEVFHSVRVSQLTLNDVALKVEPTKLLSQDQMLGLFTFLGQKAALPKDKDDKALAIHESLRAFTRRARDPRPPVGANEWDTEWHSGTVQFENKNKTAVKSGQEGQAYAISTRKRAMEKGKFSWKIRIESVGHWVFLGIGQEQFTGYTHNTAYGWASSNQTYTAGQNTISTEQVQFTIGTTVHFTFDADAQTLTFAEQPPGTANTQGRPSYTIRNIPKAKWFIAADPYNANTRLTFVDK